MMKALIFRHAILKINQQKIELKRLNQSVYTEGFGGTLI